MRFNVRPALEPFARALQRAYAQVIRGDSSGRPDGRTAGGSLSSDVSRPDLVQWSRTGFVFAPSRLGERFLRWWRGTSRQAGRGRDVPINEDALARALEEHLARQIEAEDRRTG